MPIKRKPVEISDKSEVEPAPQRRDAEGYKNKTEAVEEKIVLSREIQFFYEKLDTDGILKAIEIDYVKLIECYKSLGFARYDLDENGATFVHMEKKVITEISRNKIIDIFINYLYRLDYTEYEKVDALKLINKFYKSISTYFSLDKLDRMVLDHPITINKDSKNDAFFYYRNGYVRCTSQGWKLHDYTKLDNYIWKNQLLDRDFKQIFFKEKPLEIFGVFADFVSKICGGDGERFKSLCSIIGYNLHNYMEQKLKATIFTDSNISDIADGRTGKTLLCKSLGKMRNYVEINGKNFDPNKDKHCYQELKLDSQILHLNDVRKYFDIDLLFNDITEGIKVERKAKDPFRVSVKMIISTNQTIKIEGSSARDRTIEFEFSDYFSEKRSPQDEHGHWFFTDWDQDEWSRFDNFMMYCTSIYLEYGLCQTQSINLEARKLLDQTCQEFIQFMDDLDIKFNQGYEKKALFSSFIERFEDFRNARFTQRKFTIYLRTYAKYKAGFKEVSKETDEIRSNGKDFIIFRSDQRETSISLSCTQVN